MTRSPAGRQHRVVVIALDGVIPFEFLDPRSPVRGGPGRGRTAALRGGHRLGARGGSADQLRLPDQPGADLSAVRSADTVVVPAVELDGLNPHQVESVTEALRHRRRGARIMSICTGAQLLALAGLLDGRPATTHWNHAATFSREFPAVRLDPNVLFVDDGDVLTSAGAAAGIDLCLHLIRRDRGKQRRQHRRPRLRRRALA